MIRACVDNMFYKVLVAIIFMYAFCLIYKYNIRTSDLKLEEYQAELNRKDIVKYILRWTGITPSPFHFLGEGNSSFIKNKCTYTNCFVTDDRDLLPLKEFDAIVFNSRAILDLTPADFPTRRSPKQKYVFAATESADRFPVCDEMFDNFFNWTWTYKLNSNLLWGYITIYDTVGRKVGPAINMDWPENMEPVSDELKSKLSHKTKPAAWFVSNCKTASKREEFVDQVNEEAKEYGWKVDIYGSCHSLKCPRSDYRECNKMVQNDYFFYFSLENSFAEDYVTEKLLTALENYAVPIVFGAADYSRFLPEGSYLDGRKLGPKNLVHVINDIMSNQTRYYEFFRWRNHFTYAHTIGRTEICNICDALNDERMVNTVKVWKDLRKWWNGPGYSKNCNSYKSKS